MHGVIEKLKQVGMVLPERDETLSSVGETVGALESLLSRPPPTSKILHPHPTTLANNILPHPHPHIIPFDIPPPQLLPLPNSFPSHFQTPLDPPFLAQTIGISLLSWIGATLIDIYPSIRIPLLESMGQRSLEVYLAAEICQEFTNLGWEQAIDWLVGFGVGVSWSWWCLLVLFWLVFLLGLDGFWMMLDGGYDCDGISEFLLEAMYVYLTTKLD
jgi:hypothetical protein